MNILKCMKKLDLINQKKYVENIKETLNNDICRISTKN
jgi:hypothetical protein